MEYSSKPHERMTIFGNGGGTVGVVSALSLGSGWLFLSSSGNVVFACMFLLISVLSASLAASMLLRFYINFKKHGKALSCPQKRNRALMSTK